MTSTQDVSGVGWLVFGTFVVFGMVWFGLTYYTERWYNGHWLQHGESPFSPERRAWFRQQHPRLRSAGRVVQGIAILSFLALLVLRIGSTTTAMAVLLAGIFAGVIMVRVAARWKLWADDDRSAYERAVERAERWGLIRK